METSAQDTSPSTMLDLAALIEGVGLSLDQAKQKATEYEVMIGQIAALNQQIESFAAEKMAMEADLEDKDRTLEDLNIQIESLNEQLAAPQVTERSGETDSQLQVLTAQVADLQNQLDAAVVAKTELEQRVAAFPPVADVDSQVQELSATIAGLQQQLDVAAAANADLQQQLDSATAANADLQQQLGATQAQLDDLTGQIEQAKQTIQEVLSPEEIAALQAGEGLPTGEGGEEEDRRGLKLAVLAGGVAAAIHRSSSRADELDQATSQLSVEKAGMEASLQEKDQALSDLSSQLASLQEQFDALAAEKAGLEASLQEKDQSLASFNEQLLSLQGQVNEFASEASTNEALLVAKDQELADFQVRAEALQGRVDELGGQLAAAAAGGALLVAREQELADAQAQVQALQTQIEELSGQLEATTAEKVNLETKVQAAAPLEQALSFGERLAKLPPIKQTAASAAFVLGKQPVLTPKVQALTRVAGVGSTRQQKLYNAGVGTFWELSNLEDEDLSKVFGLSASRLQRVNLSDTRVSARQLADETDTVGLLWDGQHVDDMEQLAGIGRVFEQRLYEAGITTYEALADTSADALAEIIGAPEFNRPDYAQWVEDARALLASRAAEPPAPEELVETRSAQAAPAEEYEADTMELS